MIIYEATDRNLKFFQGNVFECSPDNIGCFDCIWDCNAMVAINPEDMQKYANLLTCLTKPRGRILMAAYEYDQSYYQGFPQTVPPEKVQKLFSDNFTHKVKETVEMGTWLLSKYNLPWALRHVHYLEMK